MSGTIQTAGDTNRITSQAGRFSGRVTLLVLVIALGVALIAWLKSSTWRAVDALQQDLAPPELQSITLVNNIRTAVARLDATLLRFQLSNAPEERDAFRAEYRALSEQIALNLHRLTTAERAAVERVKQALENYLNQAAPLLERGLVGIRRDSAAQVQLQISPLSSPVLAATSDLAQAQQAAWNQFFSQRRQSVGSVRRLLQISTIALLSSVLLIALLVYRTMISPLKVRLTESHATIDRQERLASLGVLAAGVAHEIRNPLTAIKFRLFSLKSALPAAFAEQEDLSVIHHEINRLDRIVKDFLQFARPTEPVLAPVPAGRMLENVHHLLHPQLAKCAIELKVEPVEDLVVTADQQQIEQVIINLVQNAADSIGQGGSITLRARQGVANLSRRSMPVVIMEVTDTGKGIPADVEGRIFDPFFSTKEGGTGLGLSIAARILDLHGGSLHYQTRLNHGTTFSLLLPRSAKPDHASQHPAH